MSRFIQGDCEQVMSGFPSNAVDFILTDPPRGRNKEPPEGLSD